MLRASVLAVALVGCGVDITTHGSNPSPVTGGGGGGNGGADDGGVPVGSGSNNGVDPPVDAPSGISARTFLHEAGVKQCDEAYKCIDSYPGTESQFDQDWGTSQTNCYDLTDQYFQIDDVVDEVAAGKISYDASAAAACLAGVTYGGCTTFWQQGAQFPAVCSQALVGSVAEGGSCVVTYDCASDNDICQNQTCSPSQ